MDHLSFILVFSSKHYNSYNKYCETMSTQCMLLGFELTTFET